MTNKQWQQEFLQAYLATLTDAEKASIPSLDNITAEYFCGDEYNANECARLVDIGQKTASCGLKDAWDFDGDAYSQIGELRIVTNWHNEPICIIKITEVSFAKFKDVPREFAEAEGEGDGTFEWWRQAHIDFFTAYAPSIDKEFREDSELLLERFVKVYPL